jgi:glutathione S-transferase
LEYAGLTYEAVRLESGRQSDPSYLAVNPLGRVPALVTPHGTITEVPAVLTYIAEAAPERELMPRAGSRERYEAVRWMAYLSSTVHPAFGRLWRAERFVGDSGCVPAVEQAAAAQLAKDFAHIERQLGDRQWLVGNSPSVADFYLFVFGR